MKTLNFFAIILIVAFVNSSKSVSFSDVVQSLVQLHDEPAEGLAALNAISEAFVESETQLKNVRSIVTQTCEELQTSGSLVLEAQNADIENLQRSVTLLQQGAAFSQAEVEENTSRQAEEREKLAKAESDLKALEEELHARESELNEVVNVLYRLRDFAQDELNGSVKASTSMGNYNVVSEHGVAFIQKSNIRNELKSLLKNSNVKGKSLISTLIMMTSSDDAHYSDPEVLGRVLEVLNRLINTNEENIRNGAAQFEVQANSLREIAANAQSVIENLQESSMRALLSVEIANREVSMYQNDITFLQRTLKGRNQRIADLGGYCFRQVEMNDVYNQRYSEVFNRVLEMRSELESQ